MQAFIRAVGALSRCFGLLAALCLMAACVVVCQMVFMRYVLAASTIWQTEFVMYSIIASTLLGSPYVLLTRGHVNVDLVLLYLRPGPRRWLTLLGALIGFSFCALLAWRGTEFWYEAWSLGWVSESVWAPPLWIPLLSLPLGLGMLSLQYLAEIFRLFAGRPESAAEAP